MVAAVLTVQAVSDNLRSGGSIVTVVGHGGADTAPGAAVKAALAEWTAGQSEQLGARGITINTVACGRTSQPGYTGLAAVQSSVPAEIARLALFLATPAARHITGQTLHVGGGAAASYG